MAAAGGKLSGRRFVAVDFDSLQMRIAQAELNGQGVRVRRLVDVPVPEEVSLSDATAMGKLLAEALKEHRLGTSQMVLSVPRSQAVLKPIALPPGTGTDELASMVRYQMQSELPFRLEEASVEPARTNTAKSASSKVSTPR